MADPFPKSRQLARGERRYRRKIASPKQWQAIIAEKGAVCRLSDGFWGFRTPERDGWQIEYHHLVSRARGGDDAADNIVPLCRRCHSAVTHGKQGYREALADALTDAERAYCEAKIGEAWSSRLFGVGR